MDSEFVACTYYIQFVHPTTFDRAVVISLLCVTGLLSYFHQAEKSVGTYLVSNQVSLDPGAEAQPTDVIHVLDTV